MRDVFLTVLNMSVTGGYVILVLLLARLALTRAPKRLTFALWVAALFRLCCPFSIESAFSLLPSAMRGTGAPSASGEASAIGAGGGNGFLTRAETLPIASGGSWADAAAWVWIAGIVLLLGYTVWSTARLARRLRYTRRLEQGVYEGEGLPTAFVFGLLRPRIYLPAALTEDERRCILLHERTHLRRLDHLVKPVMWAVLCLHWFNPLCWVAFFLAGDDMERACDESVLQKSGEEMKTIYSSALLRLSAGRRVVGGSPVMFGESHTKGRIVNILNYKKPAFWLILVAVLAVAAVCVGLALNPRAVETSGETESSSPESAVVSEASGSASAAETSSSSESAAPTTVPVAALTEDEYLAAVLHTLSVEDDTLRFSLPESAPDGYTISIRAYTLVPEGDGSTASSDLFPEDTMWNGGENAEYPLGENGSLPDGSEVGFTLWLVDASSTSEHWFHQSWKYADGVPVVQPDPKLTSFSIQQSGSAEDASLQNVSIEYTDNQGTRWTLAFACPKGWSFQKSADSAVLFASLDVYDGETCLGWIGYNDFDYVAEARDSDNFYISVYNGILLGSLYSFDVDYTPVRDDGDFCAAVSRVYHRDEDASAEPTYTRGVLAYSIPLEKYAAMDLDVDEAVAHAISESLTLQRS